MEIYNIIRPRTLFFILRCIINAKTSLRVSIITWLAWRFNGLYINNYFVII